MLNVPSSLKKYVIPILQELKVLWVINKMNMQKNSNKGQVWGSSEVEEMKAFLQEDSGAWLPPAVWLQNKPLIYSILVSSPIQWRALH